MTAAAAAAAATAGDRNSLSPSGTDRDAGGDPGHPVAVPSRRQQPAGPLTDRPRPGGPATGGLSGAPGPGSGARGSDYAGVKALWYPGQ